ncbi:hypothetical protein AB0F46_29670 [Streptomyces sp. NPDC026665]|uniref:hypothetical protein n=1 Tax=Streptomyces sp. NPDC026665 TaxID=3154798 RepID=UPI0033E8CB58
MTSSPERYHLTLRSHDVPVMHGYWASRSTAEGKFTRWIGEHGSIAGARVTLVDEETGNPLQSWPERS